MARKKAVAKKATAAAKKNVPFAKQLEQKNNELEKNPPGPGGCAGGNPEPRHR